MQGEIPCVMYSLEMTSSEVVAAGMLLSYLKVLHTTRKIGLAVTAAASLSWQTGVLQQTLSECFVQGQLSCWRYTKL